MATEDVLVEKAREWAKERNYVYTLAEIAAYLGVSRHKAGKIVRLGKIPRLKPATNLPLNKLSSEEVEKAVELVANMVKLYNRNVSMYRSDVDVMNKLLDSLKKGDLRLMEIDEMRRAIVLLSHISQYYWSNVTYNEEKISEEVLIERLMGVLEESIKRKVGRRLEPYGTEN